MTSTEEDPSLCASWVTARSLRLFPFLTASIVSERSRLPRVGVRSGSIGKMIGRQLNLTGLERQPVWLLSFADIRPKLYMAIAMCQANLHAINIDHVILSYLLWG